MSEDKRTIIRIPRMRTLSEVYAYIKEADSNTAISANYVCCLIISGKIPRVKMRQEVSDRYRSAAGLSGKMHGWELLNSTINIRKELDCRFDKSEHVK